MWIDHFGAVDGAQGGGAGSAGGMGAVIGGALSFGISLAGVFDQSGGGFLRGQIVGRGGAGGR